MKGDSEQGEIASDDLARIRSFIEKHNWIFAKTMPQWPHEYTLRKNANEEEFLWFVVFIRERGSAESFGGQKHIYLDVDEWKYWTMGSPLDDTILINRARTGKQSGIYDQQARV
jgi:hypothetical protein